MATQTETLLPLIDPADIVDMSIECVEVFLFQKNTFVEHSNSLKIHVKKSRSFCFRRKQLCTARTAQSHAQHASARCTDSNDTIHACVRHT